MKKTTFLFFLFLIPFYSFSQLSAGDIAFIGVNEDPGPGGDQDHSFTFITLTNIPAGEVVYFTEQGIDVNTMTWFGNNEGHYSWTSPSGGLSCGTVIAVYESVSNPETLIASSGTMSGVLNGTGWNLSAGDQVIAYQANVAAAGISSCTFIAAIHMEDDQATGETNGWTSISYSGTGVSYSHLPPGLTNGVNCISLFSPTVPEQDNAKYTGTLTGTSVALRSLINTPSNWSTDDVVAFNISTSGFTPNVNCSSCTDPTIPTVTASANPVCNGSSTTLNISGSLNDATQWAIYTGSCGGSLVGTTASSSFSVSPTTTTTYYVRGEGGCVTPGSCGTITVNVNNLATSISAQTNVACNGGNTGAATVTATGGVTPYTYSWSNGSTTASITGVVAGFYNVTVTDANGCSGSTSVTITEPSFLSLTASSQTNVSCNGGSNGAAAVSVSGGTPSYTYSWAPSGGTASFATGLAAGTYTCTVTDANGCQTSRNFNITEPTTTVNGTTVVTNVSCFGGSNGAINLTPTGGVGPYTFNWGGGVTTEDRTGLPAGSYSVTITDANGCTGSVLGITVTQPTAMNPSISSQTNVACNGGNTGAATVTPIGGTPPFTYSWSNGSTTTSITDVVAGFYNVIVTDANGCTGSTSVTITQPTAMNPSISSQTNVACNGENTGAATVTTTGGVTPYTYSWSNGSTTASITGVVAGFYNITVTDANGCTGSTSVTITEPSAINNTISENTTGILTANESGATYQWFQCPNTLLNGETNQSFTPSATGDYKVEITKGGCTIESSCYTVSTLDTKTFENEIKFIMYPNPTNGLITIKTDASGEFVIVNQLGQTVKTFKVNSNIENNINVENLSEGIYFIKSSSNSQINSQRLIIKK